ncbi:MAG: class I SAM-dependent methyltransferase [Moraxellaceae bacterium]|jgi:16S rRNA (guanine1516-N2)-methyltransferase|nr:class I SAM-dependent methyltransferase [Moraxellaceae bacterium]MBP7229591.1 class I SAM-dependent methyltransferase [Moraxellaceae bacterium]MBP8851895.1 class I SAM-dependent methyltransferase [Moraxellaceae bacterium]MBP9045016.1 class I SAM-dependent methyltransferase [Moraxellaceae bacterium]MBP9730047.1 class I SAM-dependent methyltransferase [Moraxellaceae bacterium]
MALHLLVAESCAAQEGVLSQTLALPSARFSGSLKAALNTLPQKDVALVCDEEGLALYALALPGSGPVRVALGEGVIGWRLDAERVRHEMIVKACGVKPGIETTVFDATAGLLRDAAVLAMAGCRVSLAERSPVIGLLIEDGLRRAAQHVHLQGLAQRLQFVSRDALEQLQGMADTDDRPDVVVLDPMFPHREKSALVKKEMQVFQALVGEDMDADALLLPALRVARKRVVVKRPRLAPPLAGRKPDFVIEGKSGRFDVYLPANQHKQ